MWFIELRLCTYFILERDRFLTTATFTGSASTVHSSFEIMFQNFTFWCYIKMDIKSVIRDYLLRNYDYLNTVLKSPKTRCS